MPAQAHDTVMEEADSVHIGIARMKHAAITKIPLKSLCLLPMEVAVPPLAICQFVMPMLLLHVGCKQTSVHVTITSYKLSQ